ncbi:MAG: methionyl-tRNA formyltransferase [Lachnospiraceae bacterium]|nr:methionyl-tRNA formyltransferase [Lachnospiraceae bacterium]MEE3460499.1 methionyl-tRNA formyltransferase [Lachnospiraceae bacterium]
MMKIVFMGTPDFAVSSLEALYESGNDIAAVFTQPDRMKGRSGKKVFSPVKVKALEHDTPVYQPEKIREQEYVDLLKEIDPDLIVVTAFGQILSKEILDIPKFGCINVHASLLPRWRGAAPIQWAIINGDKITGNTIMKMDEGLDTGDIIAQEEMPISSSDTGESLFDKLSAQGGELLKNVLPDIEAGNITTRRQGEPTTPYARMLKKDMGKVDFSGRASELDCLIRGLISWPGAYTFIDGKMLKIWDEEPVYFEDDLFENTHDAKNPGAYNIEKTNADKAINENAELRKAASSLKEAGDFSELSDSILIKCGEGYLRIKEVQLQGKKRMDAGSFIRGMRTETRRFG